MLAHQPCYLGKETLISYIVFIIIFGAGIDCSTLIGAEPALNWPTKFELNLASTLSASEPKLSEVARIQWSGIKS